MPKIPMMNPVPHVRVQQENLPSYDPGYREGPAGALKNFAEGTWSMANAGAGLAKTVTGAIADYKEAEQKQTDKDAINELKLIDNRQNDELSLFYSENPEQYERFSEVAADVAKKNDARRNELLGKMSAYGRRDAEAFLLVTSENRVFTAKKEGFRARVEYGQKNLANQLEECARSQNYDLGMDLIDSATISRNGEPTLFKSADRDKLTEGFISRYQAYQVETMISNGGIASVAVPKDKTAEDAVAEDHGAAPQEDVRRNMPVVKVLTEVNENGSYKYFTHLSDSDRARLVKSARSADAQRGADAVEQLENRMLTGENVSREEVEKMFEGLPHMVKYQNDALKLYDRIAESRQSKERADVRFRSFLEGEKEKAEKKKIDESNNLFRCRVMEWQAPGDPDERNEQYQAFRSEIIERTAGNPVLRKTMMAELDEQAKMPEKSYSETYSYKQSMAILDQMKEDFDCYEEAGDWFYTHDSTVRGANFAMAKVKLNEFFKANPNATVAEAQTFIEEMKKHVNAQQLADLAATWEKIKPTKSVPAKKEVMNAPADGTTGTFNGRKVIYRNGKWNYAE